MATNLFDMSLTTEQLATPVTKWFETESPALTFAERNAFLIQQVGEMLGSFAQPVTGYRKVIDVTSYPGAMVKLSEKGEAQGTGDKQIVTVDFPLFKYGVRSGWTEDYLLRASVEDFRGSVLKNELAYRNALQNEITTAIFHNVKRTVVDWLTDYSTLSVYPFINADGMAIRPAPNGTTFTAASHQHYVGTSGSAVSTYDIDTLISNVVEHGNRGIALFVDVNMPSTLAGMAGTKFNEPNWFAQINNSLTNTTIETVDPNADPANTLVGRWGSAGVPVYTRSWVPSGYIACMAVGGAEKPLGYRQDVMPSLRGLIPLSIMGGNVISSQEFRAYFGLGANNRSAGAVLDTGHQTNYTEPTGLVL